LRQNLSRTLKLAVGLAFSGFFLYLALREVKPAELWTALRTANYWWLLPTGIAMFGSHYVRAIRHRYILAPVKVMRSWDLFSALMIGYMANSVLPAHLGEILRAYVLGKKGRVPASSVLATVAVERVLDVLTLLLLMAFTLLVFPFPSWVRTSGYLTLAATLVLIGILLAMRRWRHRTGGYIERSLGFVSRRLARKVRTILEEFAEGIVPLSKKSHYVIVAVTSVVIWAGYAANIYLLFHAQDFVRIYGLGIKATLATLVIVTIAVVVPSSPRYVGTYHWLCMKALELFGVPASPALSYAVLLHGLSVFPVAALGVFLVWKEGYSLSQVRSQSAQLEPADGVQT